MVQQALIIVDIVKQSMTSMENAIAMASAMQKALLGRVAIAVKIISSLRVLTVGVMALAMLQLKKRGNMYQ